LSSCTHTVTPHHHPPSLHDALPIFNYTSPNTTGTLTFTPAVNLSGIATITVTVTDSGNTANGGKNSFVQTFNVVVGSVNQPPTLDRKSTRLNSSHVSISYAVFCLKK